MLSRSRPSPARPLQEVCPQSVFTEARKEPRAARCIRYQTKESISSPSQSLQLSCLRPQTPCNQTVICFHIDANSFCRNPLRLTLLQTARGVGVSPSIIVSHHDAGSCVVKPSAVRTMQGTAGQARSKRRGANSPEERYISIRRDFRTLGAGRVPGCAWLAFVSKMTMRILDMPIYEYICDDCGERYEQIVLSRKTAVACPRCESRRHSLQLSVFSAPAKSGNSGSSSGPGGGGMSSGPCCGSGGCGCN